MKNTRAWLVMLLSVFIGAAAVAIAARWVAQQASVTTIKVVVAARDIEVGTRLRPDMLQVIDWPAGASLKDPYTDPEKLKDRVVNAQVLRGEPVLDARLAAVGASAGLSSVLEEGKRAITVKVNEIVGVAGFALPGNYVDVMVNTPDEAKNPVSKIVLERILVLAVAQDLNPNESKPRVVNAVTLQVTPAEAEKIDLARSIGTLSLVLRSQVDKTPAETAGARRDDLLAAAGRGTNTMANRAANGTPPSVPAAATSPVAMAPVAAKPAARSTARPPQREPAPAPQVEVIRGVKKTLEPIDQ